MCGYIYMYIINIIYIYSVNYNKTVTFYHFKFCFFVRFTGIPEYLLLYFICTIYVVIDTARLTFRLSTSHLLLVITPHTKQSTCGYRLWYSGL